MASRAVPKGCLPMAQLFEPSVVLASSVAHSDPVLKSLSQALDLLIGHFSHPGTQPASCWAQSAAEPVKPSGSQSTAFKPPQPPREHMRAHSSSESLSARSCEDEDPKGHKSCKKHVS